LVYTSTGSIVLDISGENQVGYVKYPPQALAWHSILCNSM
jgi:hypothetical protein